MITIEEWDLVITDLTMPGNSGLEILDKIIRLKPQLPVLIFSMNSEEQYGLRAIKAGAAGYLSKDRADTELVHAVSKLFAGKKYITPYIAEKLVMGLEKKQQTEFHQTLSDRKLEVVRLIANGKSTAKTAGTLLLSTSTMHTLPEQDNGKIRYKIQCRSYKIFFGKKIDLRPGTFYESWWDLSLYSTLYNKPVIGMDKINQAAGVFQLQFS